jgi:NADPH:quinone reductase-like Zn-dependent oxidoreductase
MGGSAGPGVLRVGAARIALPDVMLRSGMDDPPAMIGQDVLRGTVVAVGPDQSTPVLWQVATLESQGDGGAPRRPAEPPGSV